MRYVLSLALIALAHMTLPSKAQPIGQELTITEIARGFDQPWSIGFLPDRSLLVTERDGRLMRVTDKIKHQINGVAPVRAKGQGGLLDVLVPRDFAQSRSLFFSYAKPQGSEAGTAVARARLSDNFRNLEDWTVIFEMTPGSATGRHFGSRLVEAPDGTIFVTVGDRGDRPSAQDLSRENGSVLRVAKDGSIPADNPFLTTDAAQPEIWSYGHRNPQAAALDLNGELWVVEHGAKGGDEVNKVRRGANYGWPVVSYGRHYSGKKIGEGTEKPGMEQPNYYWDPSMAPSGMLIYSGRLWPEWQGYTLVGSLKFDYIALLNGDPMQEVAQIKTPDTNRVRDVREGPDGAIWFISAETGRLFKITP